MRLGGKIVGKRLAPDEWVAALQESGFTATFWPPYALDAPDDTVRAYAEAAAKADIVVSEVIAWKNTLSPDEAERKAALERSKKALDLADRIGARCALGGAGGPNTEWEGPHPSNLTEETFEMVVETTRAIIDDVRPKRAFYTLETMPWAFPNSVANYERLLEAVDRKQFAAHCDPFNFVVSPEIYFNSAAMVREFFAKLGDRVVSCHAKDVLLHDTMTVHIEEVRAGLGTMDYSVFLKEIQRADPDMPLLIEHLKTNEEYRQAADYIRSVAKKAGVPVL